MWKNKGFTLRRTSLRENLDSDQRGFTLLEILVGLSIATLLFTGGYTSYRDFSRRQALDNSVEEFRANLTLAQQSALSGEKPTTCTGTLMGYKITFSTSYYTVFASCSTGDVAPSRVDLPSGITVSPTESVLFKVLGEGTDLTSDMVFTFTQANTNDTRQATLTTGGVLR